MVGNRGDVAFMQAMCSRICHDLSAPLGALNLAVEMLEDGWKSDGNDTLNLLTETVKDACLRLELYRCLVGFSAAPQKPALSQIRALLKNYTFKKKIQLHWAEENEREGLHARLLLSMILIAIESLPRGGEITIWPEHMSGSSTEKVVRAQGTPCLLKKDYSIALEDPNAILSADTSVIFYLKHLAAQSSQTVQTLFHKDQELILRVG